MEEDPILLDVREALGALTGDPYFAEAGIDQAFIEQFARNMMHFDGLPESTKARIAHEFGELAGEKSYRTTVDLKWDERKSQMLAEWFKGLNLLLVMSKRGLV